MATKLNEAFISELLADITVLEGKINELPSKLENTVSALDAVTDKFRNEVQEFMVDQQAQLANNVTILAQNSIRSTTNLQKMLIRSAVMEVLDEYRRSQIEEPRNNSILIAGIAVVSVLVGFGLAVLWFHAKQL